MIVLYIRRYRILRRVTQEKIAEQVDLSQQTISALESDNQDKIRAMKLGRLEDIAMSLDICPNDLVYFACKGCKRFDKCNKRNTSNREIDEFFKQHLDDYF